MRGRASANPPEAPARRSVCVARQPIFDANMAVVAYELLYRAAPQDAQARILDGSSATAHVIVGSIAEIGLDSLSGGVDIHLNLPRELIVDPVELPLKPETTVLEILETVRSDPGVVAGIKFFRNQGFRIALDDYVSKRHDEELLKLADIVKVDLLVEPAELWAQTAATLLGRGVEVVAEKVETQEQFEQCRALGIQAFQGYWFQRPETFTAHRASSDRLATLQVLAALQDAELPMETLVRVVHQDLALVYRLLRVINSGYYNLPREVTSVQEALVMLGMDNLRRLCALMALAAFESRPQELLVNALVRARMCELLATLNHPQYSAKLFFAGLLSHLDALLGVTTDEALQSLPLTKDLEQALRSYAGPIGATLQCVIAFERGRWDALDAFSQDPKLSQEIYLEAVRWADEARVLLKS
jgi:c-di-GMP phosphodiesterase